MQAHRFAAGKRIFQGLSSNLSVENNNVRCSFASFDQKPEFYHQDQPRIRGMQILKEPSINKGMAFSLRERQLLGIHGLLPPAFMSQDNQAHRVMTNIRSQPHDLARYVQLTDLQDRNEKLFYRVLIEHIEELMPIVYTPTVGLACQKFGFIFRKPKGLYITINDNTLDHIYDILCNWPETDIRAIVVTDGERILGLGDLGAYGMGIPIGKLSLYVALAGIQPQWCLPIVLDVGTDNEELLADPFYIGLRNKRVRGPEYDTFVDNFMQAVIKRFGNDTLIQFEDFGNANAFPLLEKYKDKYCTFNDDIQGTASVVLAGLLGACKVANKPLADHKIFFFGAGGAALGVSLLLVKAMEAQGVPAEEARKKIWMFDLNGLIVNTRNDLSGPKLLFAKDYEQLTSLEEAVKQIKPSILVGAATVGGTFKPSIIRLMAEYNDRPIIFALSNPTSNSECTAEEAYINTDGRAVFASGSPFKPVTYKGHTFVPGQGNNAYIFPGVAMGAVLCGVHHVTDEMFLIASTVVSQLVSEDHMKKGLVYPPLTEIRTISLKIATAVAEYSYKHGLASYYPEPADKEEFIRRQLYTPEYSEFSPSVYDWPGQKV